MKKYQVIIRFTPDTPEETIQNTLEQAKKVAELTRIDRWEKNKLVYPIRHKNRTWYNTAITYTCNVTADEEAVRKLKRVLDKEEVIKYLIIGSGGK